MERQAPQDRVRPAVEAVVDRGSEQAALLREVEAETQKAFGEDPQFKAKSLTALNNDAVALWKRGEYVRAIAAYAKVFRRVREENVTHAQLHICYGNRSAAWYALGAYEEALKDAERSRTLAELAIQRGGIFCPSYVKAHLRKGTALLAMGRAREASSVFNAALEIEPSNSGIRQGLEQATRQILSDLVEGRLIVSLQEIRNLFLGKGKETLCLPAAAPCERISNLAYATPLHKIKVDDVLPTKLLTPQQAERDHHIRDTYNYVTIQTDVQMPLRSAEGLHDRPRWELFAEAVAKAVKRIEERIMEARVLCLGGGNGLLSMVALKSGAKHVTVAERWLYLAMSCKEILEMNGFTGDQCSVVYKRPSDLLLNSDVPICCNICVNEMFDEGLLTSGILPAFKHCLDNILIHDPILIPASATVFVQAVEIRTGDVCGLDMSAVDEYRHVDAAARWLPTFTCGLPLDRGSYKPLSFAYEAWHFDFYHPPEASARHTLDVRFIEDGVFNAVLFWYELDLGEGLRFSTSPENTQQGSSSLQPCIQYLPGQLSIEKDMVYPLVCSHNTVRLRFDIEEAEYLHLTKSDPSFSHGLFSDLRDEALLQAYSSSIQTAAKKLKDRDGRVDALDVGCGSGILSVMCSKAGCSSVVACDIQQSMIDITRKTIARNRVSTRATAVCDDGGNLKRGNVIPYHGVNLVVTQLCDSGLLGYNVLGLMDCLQRNVLQHNAIAIPSKAVVCCMGVEIQTPSVQGFDFTALDKYRWDAQYNAVDLNRISHRRLTAPRKVLELSLDGCQQGRGREAIVRCQAQRAGSINAVVFWFDLHLDEDTVVTTAPERTGIDDREDDSNGTGSTENGERIHSRHLGQALQYLDESLEISAGQRFILIAKRVGGNLRFRLKQGAGVPVERAPWKVQWGGGASVENPHFQRVHYCQLLVNDFKMRCKGSRFPSIQEDLEIMHRHCGSLFLDPFSLIKIGRELVTTENLCKRTEPTPVATVDAVVGNQRTHA